MTTGFPLSAWDIVSLILGVTSITLLITSEVLSPYYGIAARARLKINKKRLKNAAIVTSIIFLATIAIKIATLM